MSADGRTLPVAAQTMSLHTRVDVFKRVSVFLPPMRQVSREPVKDSVRAAPAQRARGLKKAAHGHFDTALVRESPGPGDDDDAGQSLEGTFDADQFLW